MGKPRAREGKSCIKLTVRLFFVAGCSTRSNGLIQRRRSGLLTPLDYFLCCSVKAHVCTDKSASMDALEDSIEAFIREMPTEMLESACQNWTKRMDRLTRGRGQHLHESIFKY